MLQPEPEPVVQEGGSEPSALKSPLKHKRLAMLQVRACDPDLVSIKHSFPPFELDQVQGWGVSFPLP